MATFKYIARDKQGAEHQGSLVADTEAAVLRILDDRGLYPVRVTPQEVHLASIGLQRKVRLADLANFYNQLSDMLSGGVPMLRALDVLSRLEAGRVLPAVVRELREDVAAGASLADALEKHTVIFPELHVGMVRAGE